MDCPVCGERVDLIAHGVIAPFIRELTAQTAPDLIQLNHCASCELVSFSHRYGEAELAALYGQYREQSYLRTRQRWEPWYRSELNDAYSTETPALASRRGFMERIIESVSPAPFQLAVDFGGDEGQFFPDSAQGRRVVVDLSGKPLPTGVESAASLGEVKGQPDLVMVCHVLEHLNDPVGLLREVAAVLAPTGILYVEVPLDLPRTRAWHASDRYRGWLGFVSRGRLRTVAADFTTGVARQYGRRIPRLGLIKESEHINYFTEDSLKASLKIAGFVPVALNADPSAHVGGLRLGKLGIAARLDPQISSL